MNRMTRFIIALAILLISSNAYAVDRWSQAPQIQVSEWLTSAPPTHKPILLIFWSGASDPSGAGAERINRLYKEFYYDITFVIVSNDTKQKLSTAMQRNSLNVYAGLDYKGTTTKGYDVGKYPYYVMLNLDATIENLGDLSYVTDGDLSNLVEHNSGRNSKLRSLFNTIKSGGKSSEKDYFISVKKSNNSEYGGTLEETSDGLKFNNMTIAEILEAVLNTSKSRIDVPSKLKDQKYTIIYGHETAVSYTKYRELLAERICDELKLNIKEVETKANVYKIRCKQCEILDRQYGDLMRSNRDIETRLYREQWHYEPQRCEYGVSYRLSRSSA